MLQTEEHVVSAYSLTGVVLKSRRCMIGHERCLFRGNDEENNKIYHKAYRYLKKNIIAIKKRDGFMVQYSSQVCVCCVVKSTFPS